MNLRQFSFLLITTAMIALHGACGSQSSMPPPIMVAFTSGFLPPASMSAGSTAGIAATVTNDQANAGVNWSVTCGSALCGSFNPTSTASTIPTTYTAPASIPTGGTVTVKATSVTDGTKSISATITIN